MASGDNEIVNISEVKGEQFEILGNTITDQHTRENNLKQFTPEAVEENENKLKARIAQCKDIIESLKLELNNEKLKLEKETNMSGQPSFSEYTGVHADLSPYDVLIGDTEYTSSNTYSRRIESKLNCDENLIEYEKQLQRYQNTLNMAQTEKKNVIRKQMLTKAFKLKLLEVENQCNIELLRVKQSLQCLEPLQIIVDKWKASSNNLTYDLDNFDLIPRFPELSADSGSDINACRDECEKEEDSYQKTELTDIGKPPYEF